MYNYVPGGVLDLRGNSGNRETIFVKERAKLRLSSAEFHFRIPEEGSETAVLRIQADDGGRVSGFISSDSHRIVLAVREFSGNGSEILFGVDTKGLRPGEKSKGNITVISDLGEQIIPVTVEVIENAIELAEPQVATLEDFARVCQGSLREGFRLFTTPAFPTLLDGKNRPHMALYKGMSHNPVTYQHLEEFLVTTGKKEPITLSLDKQEKAVYHLDVPQKDTLYIYRSTWGYVRLEIEVEGDFIEVEKKVVTSEDFIGRVYGLEYIVRSDLLGEGKSFGCIRIRSVHQDLEFQVEAGRGEQRPIAASTIRKRKISWLMRDQLKLLLHRLDYRSWHDRSQKILTELREEDPSDVTALLHEAFLAYTEDNATRVMELLWPVKDGILGPANNEQKAMYLYLAKAVGLLPAEKSDIRAYLRNYQRQDPGSYLILFVLQREEDPATEQPLQRLQQLEDCFEAGCTSPFLYLETWELLAKEEALLRRLSPLMIQTLRFAQKQGLIKQSIMLRAAYLSEGLKEYSESVYRLLSEAYAENPHRDLLEAICKLIIRGEPTRPEYFRWYKAAVEEDLRITRIYEYYMETYPGSSADLLPNPVRMYFVYNNTLGERSKALLYASVILHRGEDPTSYLNYAKTMQRFALQQLSRGAVDENLAVLYGHILAAPESRLAAEELAGVLFARKVTCADPRMRRVIVCHNAFAEEESYPLAGGVAYPRIYSEDACILLEDDKQRRFASIEGLKVEKLFDEKDLAWACMDQDLDMAGLELYLCKEKAYQMDVNSHTLPVYRKAAANPAFTEDYRDIIRRKLMEYYLENADDESAQGFLDSMDAISWAAADKAPAASLLILEGRYDEAFEVVSEYGYEGIEPELLLRLANRRMLKTEFRADEELLCLAEYVFDAGKYDEILLSYLRDQMDGGLDRLGELWERIMGFQLDRDALEEKILRQAIITGGTPRQEDKLLADYLRQRGADIVAKNYLVYVSEYYFLEGRRVSDGFFERVEELLAEGNKLPPVCKLALLKHYSIRANRTDARPGVFTREQEQLIRSLLSEMNEEGFRFEYFGRLPARFTQVYQLEDKVFVEARFRPDARVVLNYKLTRNGAEEEEWHSEPMRNVYGGVFGKEFLLFYGETLTYYMRVMEDGRVRETEKEQLSLVDMDTFGSTRYKLLNRMLEARATGETEAAEEAMRRYLEQEAFADRLQLL